MDPGQTITWAGPRKADGSWTVAAGSHSTPSVVLALQVNGYMFGSATTITTLSTNAAISTSAASVSQSLQSSNPISSTVSNSESHLTVSATAGIVIAAVVLGILAASTGLFFFRRYRRQHQVTAELGNEELPKMPEAVKAQEIPNDFIRPELDGGGDLIHELHG